MSNASLRKGRFENVRRDLKKSQIPQTPNHNLLLAAALIDAVTQGQKIGGANNAS